MRKSEYIIITVVDANAFVGANIKRNLYNDFYFDSFLLVVDLLAAYGSSVYVQTEPVL